MKYSRKLKDPRWQKKRLKILERDNFECRFCENKELTLNIHHIAYHKEPWDCPDELLITLCEDCHEEESIEIKRASSQLIKLMKESGCTSSHFVDLAHTFYLKSKLTDE